MTYYRGAYTPVAFLMVFVIQDLFGSGSLFNQDILANYAIIGTAVGLLAGIVFAMKMSKNFIETGLIPMGTGGAAILIFLIPFIARPYNAIAFALLLGSLMHAVRHCEGVESPAFWHHIVIYVMFFAAITQPLWLLAEVLTAKRLKKFCFYLSGLLLIPGLLVAAPVYLYDTGIIGIDSYTLRLPLYEIKERRTNVKIII